MKMSNEEFRLLYDKYHKFSAAIIYRIVKNRDETDALCNDVFYRAYKMGKKLDVTDERKLRAFIAVTSKNCALDHLKKAYVIYEKSTVEHNNWVKITDDENSPETTILNVEKATYQKMLLSRLKKKNRLNYEIIIKVKYMGISPDDVAQEYGLTRNNINNRILRTKNWLKEELQKCYEK